jgi:hypothetical protein
MLTLNAVQDIIIPFFVGVVIPFLTNWTTARGWPIWIETVLNIALSAVTSVASTIVFDGDWHSYLLAFGVAWVGALRGHYLGFAQALYSKRVTNKHEKQDQV